MKYLISAANRWEFWETYILKNSEGTAIELEFCCKYGSVILDVPEDYIIGESFDSDDFDDEAYQIEDTGDESLEDWDVVGLSDEDAQALRTKLEEQYDPESDEYYGFREFLELNGWEFDTYSIRIPSIVAEPYDDE